MLFRSIKLFANKVNIMPNIEKLLSNQQIITRELSSLKHEVNELESLFLKVKNCNGGNNEKNLLEENQYLEKQIDITKQQLIKLEVARNIPQIEIPKRDGSGKVSDVSSTQPSIQQNTVVDQIKETQKKDASSNKEAKTKEKQPKQQNKEKSDAKKGSGDGGKEGPIDVSRLDLRIGKIVDVNKHPDADSLYVEQIDVGKDKPITVVSGLVKHIPIEEMHGRMVVLLCNLKPAKMRGITSEAMVMCASSPDKVEILQPPSGSEPGDIVHVDGYPPCPDPVLNPKKKIFETVAPDLKTDSNLNATYKGHTWTVPGKGVITTKSLTGVNIK